MGRRRGFGGKHDDGGRGSSRRGRGGRSGGVPLGPITRPLLDGRFPVGRGSRRDGLGGASNKPGLTPRKIRDQYGIRRKDQKRLQSYAEKHKLRIDVRPVNPESLRHLRHGNAIPKPQHVKAKTINKYDVMLDPKLRGKEGQVGFFHPGKTPPSRGDLSDKDWNALSKRYDDRLYEHKQYDDDMKQYAREGRLRLDDGVVKGQESGVWKPYAGDNDLWDLRHHPSGERLSTVPTGHPPRSEYDRVIDDMKDQGMGVNHGAHKYWDPQKTSEQRIYDVIDANHRPGGEPLVRFSPGERPRLVDGNGDPA